MLNILLIHITFFKWKKSAEHCINASSYYFYRILYNNRSQGEIATISPLPYSWAELLEPRPLRSFHNSSASTKLNTQALGCQAKRNFSNSCLQQISEGRNRKQELFHATHFKYIPSQIFQVSFPFLFWNKALPPLSRQLSLPFQCHAFSQESSSLLLHHFVTERHKPMLYLCCHKFLEVFIHNFPRILNRNRRQRRNRSRSKLWTEIKPVYTLYWRKGYIGKRG